MSVRPPVRPHGTTLLSLDGISQNFRSVFFENLSGKFKFHYNVKRMTALYMKTKVCWILLGTRNVSDKSCRENPNTLFVFSNFFFFSGNHAIHEMWKNEVLWDRSDENMTHAHWMLDTKATNTHSQYVTLIALPLQSLHKPVSTLRYTYSTLQPVTLCYATRTAHCSLSRCVTFFQLAISLIGHHVNKQAVNYCLFNDAASISSIRKWKLVPHIEGETQSESAREKGAEGDTRA